MGGKSLGGYIANVNWARAVACALVVGAFSLLAIEPAFAFDNLATNLVGKAQDIATAVKAILFAAAVLALLAGAAPMLWGEVKVKWMVSALAACAVISMMGALVQAFVGEA
ncbi:hypothetical protein [Sphingomonas sp. 3-13AW]|uniref:hypothetical protein n=1 Tax=Sphingomonas sp. 3-13AW TaxID=3050450 RepID=UPI003BB773CE